MYWVVLAIVIACVATFLLGYHFRSITNKIYLLEEVVKSKVDKHPEPEEPKSEIIDPDDPVQEAQWQHAQLMNKLNPDE